MSSTDCAAASKNEQPTVELKEASANTADAPSTAAGTAAESEAETEVTSQGDEKNEHGKRAADESSPLEVSPEAKKSKVDNKENTGEGEKTATDKEETAPSGEGEAGKKEPEAATAGKESTSSEDSKADKSQATASDNAAVPATEEKNDKSTA